MAAHPVLLFSYGTLRQPEVQVSIFGRTLAATSDRLEGYALGAVVIDDPGVVAISGAQTHLILRRAPGADAIAGLALEVTAADLAAADAYETAAYARVETTLGSGRRAFVYVEPETAEPSVES